MLLLPGLGLCKPNFLGVVVISDRQSLKSCLILEYEISFVSLTFDDLTLFLVCDRLMDFLCHYKYLHCVKSVQKSFFWSVFSCIRTEYGDLFSPGEGQYGAEKTPCLDRQG